MTVKILQKNEPVLRKVALEVPLKDIRSAKINKIIESMREAMNTEEDAVAIAAPQIGESLRIFVVSGRAVSLPKASEKQKTSVKKSDRKEVMATDREGASDIIFINPVIVKTSRKKAVMQEGCLSVRWLYGKVPRSEKVTIRALDEKGNEFVRGAAGLLAQIFQHESDHLDGILFIDKAEDVEELPPEHSRTISN